MVETWRIIFACQKGTTANAQQVYNSLIYAALIHKYGSGAIAVQINDLALTNAIFDLTDHVSIKTRFESVERTMSGKDLKELFIASIMLKHLEEKPEYPDGMGLFVVQPEKVGPCDVAIIASKPTEVKLHGGDSLRLSADHDSYPLQIKEYFEYGRNRNFIATPSSIDTSKLSKLVSGYEEFVLVLMRDSIAFRSLDLDVFLISIRKLALYLCPVSRQFHLRNQMEMFKKSIVRLRNIII